MANYVSKDGLNYFWGKLKDKFALLSGCTFTGQIQSTNSDVSFKHTNGSNAVGFGVGSGKVNRGVYDYTNSQWLIYCANNKYPLLSQSPTTSDNSLKVATTEFVKSQGYLTSVPSNYLTTTSNVKEAYLSWGGKNFSGSYGCIDAAMVGELGANRLAFGKADGIIIEYSRDNGATWSDYEASDSVKKKLFAQGGAGLVIGKSTKDNRANENCLLRVTIDTNVFSVYTVLNKFVIYISTNGSTGSWCTIDASFEATPETFTVFADKIYVSGWSGYNVINTNGITTYGNTPATQYGLVRFTFGCTSHTSTSYAGLTISKIMGFGGVGWTTPSTMASNGHLYSYDENKNATFPANVTATQFNGALNGNASTATKLGTSTVGSTTQAIYLNAGTPTAITNSTFANTLITSLPTWTADPTDNTYFVRQDTGGSDQYGRVKASTFYNYIKGKLDSVYQPKGTYLTSHQDISGKVNKTGDAMTGALSIQIPNTTTGDNKDALRILPVYGDSGNSDVSDSNIGFGYINSSKNWVNRSRIGYHTFSGENSSSDNLTMSVGNNYLKIANTSNDNGTTSRIYLSQNPASTSNDTDIATTKWVKDLGYLTSSSTLDATKLSGTIPTSCYTNTKNTAGSTASTSKLYIIGATSQGANPQTYSNANCYVGTDNCLYSNGTKVITDISGKLDASKVTDNALSYPPSNQLSHSSVPNGYAVLTKLADYVPTTRTVNSKALSTNITLTAGDVGAYSKTETDNLFDSKVDKYIDQKLYENDYFYNSITNGNCTGYDREFATVVADEYNTPWCVKLLIEAELNYNGTIYTQRSEAFIGVTGATGTTWVHNFNVSENTSYSAFVYINVYRPATSTKAQTQPFRLMLRSGSQSSKTAYPRKYKITLIDNINCTATLNETLDNQAYQKWAYDDTTKAYYDGTTFRTTNFDCQTNGLQETGDANNYEIVSHYYAYYVAGTGGINRYTIIMQDKDGKYQSIVNEDNNYSSSLNKTANTAQFRLNTPMFYYNSSSKLSNGSRCGAGTLRSVSGLIDMRYSLNIYNNATAKLTAYAKIYLVGTVDSDGYFKLDTTKWWAEAEPTTDDGKVYIYLGIAYPDTYPYRIAPELEFANNAYWYKNGAFRHYPDYGYTVEANVPADAKFTDTVVDISGKLNTTGGTLTGNLTVKETTKKSTDTVTSNVYREIRFVENDNVTEGDIRAIHEPSGARLLQLSAVKGSTWSTIQVGVTNDGVGYANFTQNIATNNNGNQIATTSFVKKQLVVEKLTLAQTINASSNGYIDFSTYKEGYNAIGMIAFNTGSSGTSQNNLNYWGWWIGNVGATNETLRVAIKNLTATNSTVTCVATVLYQAK